MAARKYLQRSACLILLAFLVPGCGTLRQPPPEDGIYKARVYGMQDIRAFGGVPNESFKQDFIKLAEQNKDPNPTYPLLSVSGGGANGAYGAGLLCGWSQAGTRPEFKVVTGISAFCFSG